MVIFKVLVVQKMDKAIFWINLYPTQLGSLIYMYTLDYGVHLWTKIIENKRQFEVQKLDYPFRNLVI